MMTRLLFVVWSISSFGFLATSKSQAAFFLTGAQIYAAQSDGSVDPNNFSYRFTTNNSDNGGKLGVTSNRGGNLVTALNSKSISFALAAGDTVFDFSGKNFSGPDFPLPGTYLGLNLFFTDDDQPTDNTNGVVDNTYNPSTLGIRPGDISAFAQLDGGFDKVVDNGIVQNYMYVGYSYDTSVNKPRASGSLSFVLGDNIVTVTGFTANNTGGFPAGSFTLSVTATPEPSTIGIGALAFCGLAGWVKKRRGKKLVADRK